MKDVQGNQHGDVRREYDAESLAANQLAADPLDQFSLWLQQAQTAQLIDATAMTLATADEQGRPAARIVLLKHHDAEGFVFYSDYGSLKGRHLDINPRAELLFYWRELERQVRISGRVAKTSREDSAAYFASRPLESQISALASAQSSPVASREVLEQTAREWRAHQKPLPLADDWGGYRLQAEQYEFWQGRANRLHDRFRYERAGPGWQTVRLQP